MYKNNLKLYVQKYNECSFNSKKVKIENKQNLKIFIKAIKSDLSISNEVINKMKVYKCLKCNILQSNPWFKESIGKKIYSNIYVNIIKIGQIF